MARFAAVPAVLLLALVAAPAASAATAVLGASTLTVTGTGSDETFVVSQNGPSVRVVGPSGFADPDGAGTSCSLFSSTTVECLGVFVTGVVVNAQGGVDRLRNLRPGTVGNADSLNGELGNDILSYEPTGRGTALNVDLNGGPGDDDLTKEFFAGSALADAVNSTLDGGADNDTLNAGTTALGAADVGGLGNDRFNGNASIEDRAVAEAGADTYRLGTAAPTADETLDQDTFQLSFVPDTVDYSARATRLTVTLDNQANDGESGEGDDVGSDVEAVIGGSNVDELSAGSLAADLRGGAGDDVLTGGLSDDLVVGDAGSDRLAGGPGADFLSDGDFTPSVSDVPLPAAGNDVLDGGPGADDMEIDRGADDVSGGDGTDRVGFGSRPITQGSAVTTPVVFADFVITLDNLANDGAGDGDNIHTDVEEIETGFGDDVIRGTAASESFDTGAGRDNVVPGAGTDVVDLGRGDDAIDSVDGTADRIACGDGNDTASVDLGGQQPERADVLSECENVSGTPLPAPPAGSTVFVPVPPGAAPDITAPRVTLGGATTTKVADFLKKGTLKVTVRCTEACSAAGELFTTAAKLASVGQLSIGSGSIGRGTGTRTLTVKVSSKLLKAFKKKLKSSKARKKGVSLSLVVTVKDAAGNARTAKRTLAVKG